MLRNRTVASQRELVDALAAAGCDVTQATISRDLREIGLQKGRDIGGRIALRVRAQPRRAARSARRPAAGC